VRKKNEKLAVTKIKQGYMDWGREADTLAHTDKDSLI